MNNTQRLGGGSSSHLKRANICRVTSSYVFLFLFSSFTIRRSDPEISAEFNPFSDCRPPQKPEAVVPGNTRPSDSFLVVKYVLASPLARSAKRGRELLGSRGPF